MAHLGYTGDGIQDFIDVRQTHLLAGFVSVCLKSQHSRDRRGKHFFSEFLDSQAYTETLAQDK